MVADVLERKPYPDAPVSNLYLWGRIQDLAFEQPVGNSPKQRHHVRFWRSAEVDDNGEPLWLGAADVRRRGRDQPHNRRHHASHQPRSG